jgi:hypothetical protein
MAMLSRPSVEAEWLIAARDRPLLTMVVLCGLCLRRVLVGSMRDRVGQLGESGEYWMGWVRVVYFHIWSSEGGSTACVD